MITNNPFRPAEPRNELIPRQSNIKAFLTEEEFNAIPKPILEAAAAAGTEKHDIVARGYGEPTDNLLIRMFTEGMTQIFKPEELEIKPVFEEQLNGSRFTGAPDVRHLKTIIDNKFSIELRPDTALQLVMYGMLIDEIYDVQANRFFAFHFPKNHGLFIHRVPDEAIRPLMEFAVYIIKNHEAIKEGELEKYEAIVIWEKLLQDYDVFELVGQVLPPMMITDEDGAVDAAIQLYHIKEVLEREKILKREIRRYMEENGISKIEDVSGYGVRLQRCASIKVYDPERKKAAKSIYNASLKDCLLEEHPNQSLVRFAPKKTKPKQLN